MIKVKVKINANAKVKVKVKIKVKFRVKVTSRLRSIMIKEIKKYEYVTYRVSQ